MHRILFLALFLAACSVRAPDPLVVRPGTMARYDWLDNQDHDWFRERIPYLATPDASIDEIYYYRWELITKHLVYGSPQAGYTLTEFIDRPFWSGAYGAISCPLGHQMTEIRWLKDHRIVDDFARYWMDTPGAEPRSYSNWYGNALWQTYQVNGRRDWIVSMLPRMERQVKGWLAERYDPDHGMFLWNGMRDGMETNINSRQTEAEFDGAWGYRPTLNSYLYADFLAMSHVADLAGRASMAADYAGRASALRDRVIEELWDPERQFFFHQWAGDHPSGVKAFSLTHQTGPFAGSMYGRELIGYVPWQFNLPLPEHAPAWKYLLDPSYFQAERGPTTAERNDPLFWISPRCCVWSGQSWPYATTQTLVAMANLLNNYQQDVVDSNDYFRLFKTYTDTHRKGGRPYIAESAHPDTGSWEGSDLENHSEHYLHSGYIDLVISGLIGLRPSASDTLVINPLVPDSWDWFVLGAVEYHGLYLDIVWDRTGRHFGQGEGFQVMVQGEVAASRPDLGTVTVILPPSPEPEPVVRRSNVAVNNGTLWPRVTASFSDPRHPPEFAVDGSYWYHETPSNRWTTLASPDSTDWLRVDFGAPRSIEEIKLYYLDDGGAIQTPTRTVIELLTDAGWTRPVSASSRYGRPVGHRANSVTFSPITATAVRATFYHAPGARTGLTEFEAWTSAPAEKLPVPPGSPNLARGPGVTLSVSQGTDPGVLNDGVFGFTTYQGARWVPDGEAPSDWVQVKFGAVVTVGSVEAFLWGNPPRYLPGSTEQVQAPESIAVHVWKGGQWVSVDDVHTHPERPLAMARNLVTFAPVDTDRLRLTVVHKAGFTSGLSELAAYPPEQ